MSDVIGYNARNVDLSPRIFRSDAVAGSPALAAETVVCTLTIDASLTVVFGVLLFGYAAWTVGTSGSAVNLRLRQTGTSGTVIKASGATTATAGNLDARSIQGIDTAPSGAQVYVLTMTVTAGAAASTVSAAELIAVVI